jgi:DNA invertase Pin-like site-specific DNA recombinase
MLAAVAEIDRDLLVAGTQSGLALVRAEGKTPGRRTSTTEERRADMVRQRQAGGGNQCPGFTILLSGCEGYLLY